MNTITVIICFLSNLPGLYSATYDNGATCLFPIQVNTTTEFSYHYLKISDGIKRIDFEVTANNDVHIALSAFQSSREHYEIVIGAGNNTHSAIRRCSLCLNEADTRTEGIVIQFEFRRFWITFKCNGNIAVGRNDKTMPFLEWNDPNPLVVNYIGYSTGWGSTGVFRFCNFGEKYDIVRENLALLLTCEVDSVIYTTGAFYGYELTHSTSGVLERDTGEVQGCFAENSKQIVSSACNHRQYCTLVASNRVFGDPCVGITKYLRVSYMCIPGKDSYSTSPLPYVALGMLSTQATPTTEDNDLGVTGKVPVWSIVTICVMGLLLLLFWVIFPLLKMIRSKRETPDATPPTYEVSLQNEMYMSIQDDGFQIYRGGGQVPTTTHTCHTSLNATEQAELKANYDEYLGNYVDMTAG